MIDRSSTVETLPSTVSALSTYRELIKNLVLKDLKLKYRGSMLGFAWSLLNPLLMTAVYSLAFTYILPTRVEGFTFFLLLGLLPWGFFANAASMSTGAIIDSGSLMKSVRFPRAILPVSGVLFNFAQFLLTIVVFLPLMLAIYRVAPALPMLLFPVFLALQLLFTIGVALLLAAGTTFFRDIRHLLDIALSVLFWLTPIVYSLDYVPGRLKDAILLTPMSPFILAYHDIFYYSRWPTMGVWVAATGYSVVTLLVGARVFLSVEDRLSEHI